MIFAHSVVDYEKQSKVKGRSYMTPYSYVQTPSMADPVMAWYSYSFSINMAVPLSREATVCRSKSALQNTRTIVSRRR